MHGAQQTHTGDEDSASASPFGLRASQWPHQPWQMAWAASTILSTGTQADPGVRFHCRPERNTNMTSGEPSNWKGHLPLHLSDRNQALDTDKV